MNPIVSIVLPTYNRAHVIKASIGSVLAQTYQNYELIIVDDASTDCTKGIVSSYSDARILYIQSKKNSGAAAARNIGADKARGFYLAFQDSDTIWASSKLELQIQFLSVHPEIVLVFHPYLSINEKQTVFDPPRLRLSSLSSHIFYDLLAGPLIGAPTIVMKTDVFRSLHGFAEQFRSFEDYEFSIRVAKDYEIGCLPDALLRSYHPDAGINLNYHEILHTNFYILKKYQSIIASDMNLEATQAERLFYYAILGNDDQYFFNELADYVLATGHRKIYNDYLNLYNHLLTGTDDL